MPLARNSIRRYFPFIVEGGGCMKTANNESRRNFIVGGAAVVAVAGPLALAARVGSNDTRDTWSPTAGARTQAEIGEWEAVLDQKFQISGEFGAAAARLSAVVHGASDPLRPTSLPRALTYMVYFETGTRIAPKGQKTYSVVHPTKGAMEMFLGRGVDTAGQAVLYAVFN
jgi:hypothetical protein